MAALANLRSGNREGKLPWARELPYSLTHSECPDIVKSVREATLSKADVVHLCMFGRTHDCSSNMFLAKTYAIGIAKAAMP